MLELPVNLPTISEIYGKMLVFWSWITFRMTTHRPRFGFPLQLISFTDGRKHFFPLKNIRPVVAAHKVCVTGISQPSHPVSVHSSIISDSRTTLNNHNIDLGLQVKCTLLRLHMVLLTTRNPTRVGADAIRNTTSSLPQLYNQENMRHRNIGKTLSLKSSYGHGKIALHNTYISP